MKNKIQRFSKKRQAYTNAKEALNIQSPINTNKINDSKILAFSDYVSLWVNDSFSIDISFTYFKARREQPHKLHICCRMNNSNLDNDINDLDINISNTRMKYNLNDIDKIIQESIGVYLKYLDLFFDITSIERLNF